MANQILIGYKNNGTTDKTLSIKTDKPLDSFAFKELVDLVKGSCYDFDVGKYEFEYDLKKADIKIKSFTEG